MSETFRIQVYPQDRVKLFASPPPFLKGGNLLRFPSVWLNLQAPKTFCARLPPLTWLKPLSLPFRSVAPLPSSPLLMASLLLYCTIIMMGVYPQTLRHSDPPNRNGCREGLSSCGALDGHTGNNCSPRITRPSIVHISS